MFNKDFFKRLFKNVFVGLALVIIVLIAIKPLLFKNDVKLGFETLKDLNTSSQVVPLLSPDIKKPTMANAYKIQKLLVDNSDKKIYGFKAALTSAGAQKKFGLNSPLTGVLFADANLNKGAKIKASDFSDLKIETEIAFVANQEISSKIDEKDIKAYIKAVAPAIELPSLIFDDMKNMQGFDLVAANSGSNKFIIGQEMPLGDFDINSVQVEMFLNQESIYNASATEVMQDQLKALTWIINELVEQGWVIQKDSVFLTGALGKVLPAKAGVYKAVWSDLGSIEFEVE